MHAASSTRRTTAALGAVIIGSALLATACSGSSDAALPASPAAAASTSTASASAMSSPTASPTLTPTASPTATPTGSPAAVVPKPLGVGAVRHFTGRSGSYSWDLTYRSFSGGPAADEANRRLQATLATAAKAWERGIYAEGEPVSDDKRVLTGRATVSVNDARTVQVQVDTYHMVEGAAHGEASAFTMALDVTVAPARPLLLRGIVRDPATAYATFKREITRQAAARGGSVEPDGVAPRDANWAAWQAGSRGLTFSFASYQLGGAPSQQYTVPWSVARTVLTPAAYRLLGPA